MGESPSRRFPVTVTQLPVTRCEVCRRTVAYRPGRLSEVLTKHYRRAHPDVLGVPSQEPPHVAALPRGYCHRAPKVFRDAQRERGGVVSGERVRDSGSPARRCRAGLGVHGVGGVLILLR
jgi:hypothetical protein